MDVYLRDVHFASMGPQLDSCGRARPRRSIEVGMSASMGPQLDSCGRQRLDAGRCRKVPQLQWGRNLIVAEGIVRVTGAETSLELQWGRNLIVAEGTAAQPKPRGLMELQWGRNLIVAEGVVQSITDWKSAVASMGPQLDSCGRPRSPTATRAWSTCFNGAAT